LRIWIIAAALAAVAGSAAAQDLTAGLYGCYIGNAFLGEIEIRAGQYRGPAYDQKFEDGWYPFELAGPTINWGGPLGGISEAGSVDASVLKNAGGGKVGFDITIRNKDSGNFQTISCSP
jgi:hypothetical protein